MSITYTGKEQNIVTVVVINTFSSQLASVTAIASAETGYVGIFENTIGVGVTPPVEVFCYYVEFDTEENANAFLGKYNLKYVGSDVWLVTRILSSQIN